MATITFDDRGWPVAYMRITGKMTVADISDMLSYLGRMLARPGNFCMVADLTECDVPPLSVGVEIQKLLAPVRDDLRRRLMGTALIIKSSTVRTAINAILLLIRLPHPTRLVASREEAEDYCRAALSHQKQAAI